VLSDEHERLYGGQRSAATGQGGRMPRQHRPRGIEKLAMSKRYLLQVFNKTDTFHGEVAEDNATCIATPASRPFVDAEA
jgi:hypothetical protein